MSIRKKVNLVSIFILVIMLIFSAQFGLAANKISAQLSITNPASGAIFSPGQNIDITCTMNPQAIPLTQNMVVKIIKNNQVMAQQSFGNLQPTMNVQLQVPANMETGPASIFVLLSPNTSITGYQEVKNINPKNAFEFSRRA